MSTTGVTDSTQVSVISVPPEIEFMTKFRTNSRAVNIVPRNSIGRPFAAIFSVAIAAVFLGNTAPALAMHPECSSALSDSDGDGWGWENNRSCVVSAQSPVQEIPVTTGSISGLPVCVSASSDPDGDGYGWENNRSCVVATDSPAQENPATTVNSSGLAVCESADSDSDGDGYGWENNQSCLVTGDTQAPVTQPTPPAPPVGELRFMALGDSITHGVSRELSISYRRDLTELLDSAGCSYTMVGSQQSNFGHQSFISPHEGYSGHRADHFLTGLNNSAGNNEGVAVAVNRYSPSLVLLHLGTNDMLQNQVVEDTVAEIDQVISIILNSGADVLVANVIPVFISGVQNRAQQLGDQLQSYVSQLGNPRVRLVDVRSGFTGAMMLSDNVHPNRAGELHIARAFFNAVQNAGKCIQR